MQQWKKTPNLSVFIPDVRFRLQSVEIKCGLVEGSLFCAGSHSNFSDSLPSNKLAPPTWWYDIRPGHAQPAAPSSTDRFHQSVTAPPRPERSSNQRSSAESQAAKNKLSHYVHSGKQFSSQISGWKHRLKNRHNGGKEARVPGNKHERCVFFKKRLLFLLLCVFSAGRTVKL